jgi:glucans biosynthesis protein
MRPKRDPSPMNQAPRCHAKSKRTGKQCQAPAVRGYNVCRMHGARGGAPEGNNNALKHGYYSAEAVQQRRVVSELIRRSRETIGSIR